MILFPDCKINIGLRVTARRPDGYHEIETVMVPCDWHDILEIVPAAGTVTTLTTTGRPVDCPPEKNLVMKAYRAVEQVCPLPPVDMFLHKVVPDGAGLGGGSADAAYTIRGLNEMLQLGLDQATMADIAATVGSDCPFFIYDRPMLATGTGTTLRPVDVAGLDGMWLLVSKPQASVSTREAYAGITPQPADTPLPKLLSSSPDQWTRLGVSNDFEATILPLHPEIGRVKQTMLDAGAVWASMTGSGAAVVGLFESDILAGRAMERLDGCDNHLCPTAK